MDAVAVQAEIKAVVDILNDVKESKDVSQLDSAVDRLLTLQRQVAVKKGAGLAGNAGGDSFFHTNDKY